MKFFYIVFGFLIMSSRLVAQPMSDNNTQNVVANIVPSITISSFMVPANNNRLLVVCTVNASNAAAPTVTFNGTTMTSAVTRSSTSGLRSAMYYLLLGSNASATTASIVASGSSLIHLGAISYHDVNQTDPTDGETSSSFSPPGTTTSHTQTVTSRNNNVVCDCIGAFSPDFVGFTVDPSQSQLFQGSLSSPKVNMGMSTKAGASSVPMTWSINDNNSFTGGTGVHLGINIIWVNTILPIELTYFKGQVLKTGNQLLWQTNSELNNKGFYIQRAMDGIKWEDLSFVSGKGSSATINNYNWMDETPLSLTNYYRLKQLDNDGSFSYSPIISMGKKKTQGLLLYPNPTYDMLNYQYDDDDLSQITRVQIYDATGKLMQQTKHINGSFSMQDLPSGLYLFVMNTNNGSLQQRIVKQ